MTIMSNSGKTPESLGRWKLNTFQENKQDLSKNPLIAKLAQELVDSKDKAKKEGFDQGFEEGKKQGHEAGYQTGLAEGQHLIQENIQYLYQIEENLKKLYAYSREYLTQEIIDLAIDLARAVIMRSIAQQPDCIVDIVEKSLEQIPILQLPAKIFLHPLDAQLIEANPQRNIQEEGWRIVADPTISRGGCRLETGNNDIDATLEGRISRMMAALGKVAPPNILENL
jgi:flagellar assembly protein FliH